MPKESFLKMVQQELIKLALKRLTPWLSSVIVALPTYFYMLDAALFEDQQIRKTILAATATILGISILFLLSALRIYLRYGQFREEYGLYWDKDFNMRCMSCKKPVKHSSHGPEVFWCSDPECNSKYLLRDNDGNFITKQEAINRMKNS